MKYELVFVVPKSDKYWFNKKLLFVWTDLNIVSQLKRSAALDICNCILFVTIENDFNAILIEIGPMKMMTKYLLAKLHFWRLKITTESLFTNERWVL